MSTKRIFELVSLADYSGVGPTRTKKKLEKVKEKKLNERCVLFWLVENDNNSNKKNKVTYDNSF